ncbi:MAG: hypothetical protein ACMG6S_00795 [Byssovorax sp.]
MSNQQGDKPPSAAPAGAYGPGHTILGEPAFVEENAPAAFPPQATPAAPYAGAAVPATVFDANAFVPAPEYPVSPYAAGNTAPAAGYGPAPGYGPPAPGYGPPAYGMPGGPPPTAGYTAPAPNPYGGPPPAYPAPPPQRSAPRAASGPPLLIIGLAAFAVIGGLTTFFALRGRSSSEDSDKPIPTIDLPPLATVPSDPAPGAAGDPTEPPPPVPVAPPAAVVPTPVVPKPTATTPKPAATTPKPTPTVPTRPTATTPPTSTPPPTSTTKPTGPVIVPRRPIPKR